MRDIKKGSASYIILTILEKSIDGFLKVQDLRQHPAAYMYYGGRDVPKSALSQAIKRLKDGGFIQKVKIGNEVVLKLLKSIDYIIDGNESEANWDGKWRIVSFDIPEEKRIVRNLLRRNLKKWGFKHLQKSVWISKKNVYEKLVTYVQDLGIKEWVTIIEADKISGVYH